jgi:hypothetical protein
MADTEQQAAARARLDAIVRDAVHGPGVDEGPIFSSTGWRVHGKVFAFAARSGELVLKLPEARVRELVVAGDGDPMTLGTRTMREWVRIAPAGDWEPLVVEAHRFGAG